MTTITIAIACGVVVCALAYPRFNTALKRWYIIYLRD